MTHNSDAKAAFEELALLVLADQSMDGLLHRIGVLAQGVVPGANEVSVTLIAHETPTTVASTGAMATALDQRQYADGTGPCLEAARTDTVESIPDMRSETRWPSFAEACIAAGALSTLSMPIPLQGYAKAAFNMYATKVHAFEGESQEVAQSFADYAGVALANMHLYESTRTLAEQLQAAMQSRAVIEQAKGILMGQRRCTPDEAFDILVKLSQQSNRKLREVAQALVDATLVT